MRSVFHHRGTQRDLSCDDWAATIERLGFSAVIFDCDGTLVHSAEAHFCAMQTAAQAQGHSMSAEWYRLRTGLDRHSIFEALCFEVGGGFDVERAKRESIDAFGQFSQLIKPIKRVADIVAFLNSKAIPMAVVTNAERGVAMLSLERVGLADAFDVLVSVSDGFAPKPSPIMFDAAIKHLGASADATLVFEDSPEGVEAACLAGASVVRVID